MTSQQGPLEPWGENAIGHLQRLTAVDLCVVVGVITHTSTQEHGSATVNFTGVVTLIVAHAVKEQRNLRVNKQRTMQNECNNIYI